MEDTGDGASTILAYRSWKNVLRVHLEGSESDHGKTARHPFCSTGTELQPKPIEAV